MKHLLSQLVIAGVEHDGKLSPKAEKVFEKFYHALEGKYFVGSDDKNQTVRFRIGRIGYAGRLVSITKSGDTAPCVTIHASKFNWFNTPTKGSGAWIEGCGSII